MPKFGLNPFENRITFERSTAFHYWSRTQSKSLREQGYVWTRTGAVSAGKPGLNPFENRVTFEQFDKWVYAGGKVSKSLREQGYVWTVTLLRNAKTPPSKSLREQGYVWTLPLLRLLQKEKSLNPFENRVTFERLFHVELTITVTV